MTSAEDEEDTMDATLAGLHGFAMCVDGYDEKGILYGKGVTEKGEVKDRPELMQIAYEMGQSVHDWYKESKAGLRWQARLFYKKPPL